MAKRTFKIVPRYFGFRIYAISTILFMFLVFPIAGMLLIKHAPDLQKYKTGDYEFDMPEDISLTQDSISMTYGDSNIEDGMADILPNIDTVYANEALVDTTRDGQVDGKLPRTGVLRLRLLYVEAGPGLVFGRA